ncbi:MAG: DHA2 family efflux MFS transporter permease subunit, partial [Pseudomonadota bacterium]|nr:DHA2 family efflux MFS transporter permease subunit [Pseudomonadota bacterium]
MPTALHPPLTGKKLAIGAIAVALATFMAVLDTTIANVSIPVIAGDMAVPPNQGTWIIIVFIVANAIMLPLTGWLTQRFGIVRLFVLSIMAFSITSFMCGISPSFETLLVSRFLQGAVSAPMIPLSQALLLSSFPKHQAGQALAIWSMTAVVAPVLGPILGGIITDEYSWPWIFYINVPVGMIVAAVCWYIFRTRETSIKKTPVDFIGLILLIVWVSALQIMLEKGIELDWFSSDEIVFLTTMAASCLIIFIYWELTHPTP